MCVCCRSVCEDDAEVGAASSPGSISLWCFHEVLITAPERHLSVWNREEHRGSVSTSGDALEQVVAERETQTPPRGGGEGW